MTDLRLHNEDFSEHFEVTTQADSPSDSPINPALIAMAQEVAELLKQAYPVQADNVCAHRRYSSRSSIISRISTNREPKAVNLYSTRGGISG
jgi:hypothetical protein